MPRDLYSPISFHYNSVPEMNYCWEAMSIPMTTSVSSDTSTTYYSVSTRGNHLLKNEGKLLFPFLLSSRLYMHNNILKNISILWQNFVRQLSCAALNHFFTLHFDAQVLTQTFPTGRHLWTMHRVISYCFIHTCFIEFIM